MDGEGVDTDKTDHVVSLVSANGMLKSGKYGLLYTTIFLLEENFIDNLLYKKDKLSYITKVGLLTVYNNNHFRIYFCRKVSI